jgi:hypothetical protein
LSHINSDYVLIGTVQDLEEQPPKKDGGHPWYTFTFRGLFPARGGTETRLLPFRAYGYAARDIGKMKNGEPIQLTIELSEYNGYPRPGIYSVKSLGEAPAEDGPKPSDGLDFDTRPVLAEMAATLPDDSIPF